MLIDLSSLQNLITALVGKGIDLLMLVFIDAIRCMID